MSRWTLVLLLLAASGARAGGSRGNPEPRSDQWNRYVDDRVVTGDGRGHGPDPGSGEWRGVVESSLGVRGRPEVPGRDSRAWCDYIDRLLRRR